MSPRPAAGQGPRSRNVAVGTLAGVELLSWGTLYYAYPVAAPKVAEATGWSPALLAGIYSMSLLFAAIAGVILSRVVDHAGDLRRVMPWCSLLGGCGLLLAASGDLWTFALGWSLIGVAQAGTLWAPAFVAITRWYPGGGGHWPLTVITAVGGSASLVFAPGVAALVTAHGWQTAFVMLGVLYAGISIPSQLIGLRVTWAPTVEKTMASKEAVRATVRQPRFIVLQACMLVTGIALFSVTLNGVPLAQERGASYAAAAVIFGLVGFGQVVGRVTFTMLPRQASAQLQTRTLMLAASVAILGLAFAPPFLPLAALAVAAGAVRGSHTLLMRNGVLERWGPANFGAVMGWFNLPVAIGIAASPLIGASLSSMTGSYTAAAIVVGVAALAASALTSRT